MPAIARRLPIFLPQAAIALAALLFMVSLAARPALAQLDSPSLLDDPLFSGDSLLTDDLEGIDNVPPGLEMVEPPTGERVSPTTQPYYTRDNPPVNDYDEHDDHSMLADDSGMYDMESDITLLPAPTESSGTWFRRGFWYAEQDVVILKRLIISNIGLARDNSVTVFPGLGTEASDRSLTVNRSKPGAEAAGRFTFGRFLFRDLENRDHFAEFTTFLGLGDWHQEGEIEAASGEADISLVDLPFSETFNFNNRQRFLYDSSFDSFELNYRMRRRLRRDQMTLQPNGQWVRRLEPGLIYSYLFGLRFMEVLEDFRHTSFNFDAGEGLELTRGDLRVGTDNRLLGLQFGGDAIYQTDRWSVSLKGKGGPYVNFAKMTSSVTAFDLVAEGNPGTVTSSRLHDDTIAFIGELGVQASYFLRQDVSLRVGYDAMWVQAIAIAPEQHVLDTADPILRDKGGHSYHGFSVGFDIYW